jgi:DNA-binding XRE family transcriptional regulator
MRDGSEPLTERLLADLGELIRVGDYSQSTVARALGVPRSRVCEWLKGTCRPSLETGLAIAEHVRNFKRRQKRRAKAEPNNLKEVAGSLCQCGRSDSDE